MKRVIRILVLIGTLMLPLLLSLTASAEVTTLSTSVPKQVTLSVEITGKGTVTINGQATSKKAQYLVDRLENVDVLIAAHSAYLLETVHLDGTDVTDKVNNGLLTIENIQFDTDLAIKFVPKEPGGLVDVPATGDTSHIHAILLCWFGSLTMLVILLCSKRKKKQ